VLTRGYIHDVATTAIGRLSAVVVSQFVRGSFKAQCVIPITRCSCISADDRGLEKPTLGLLSENRMFGRFPQIGAGRF
jgi:hypothetical protein